MDENVVKNMMMVKGDQLLGIRKGGSAGGGGSSSRSSSSDVNISTPNNKKKVKGVRMRKWGRWVAEIRQPNSRHRIWLGSYDTEEEAGRAYDAAVYCLRGPDAILNFPEDPPPPHHLLVNGNGTLLSPSQIQLAATKHARKYYYKKVKKDVHELIPHQTNICTSSSSSSSHYYNDDDDDAAVLQLVESAILSKEDPIPHQQQQQQVCFNFGGDFSTGGDYYVAAAAAADHDYTNILIQGNHTLSDETTFHDPLNLWSF